MSHTPSIPGPDSTATPLATIGGVALSDDGLPFFKRLDIRWKSNKNLRDGALDYTHIAKLEKAGLIDVGVQHRKRFLGTFPTKLRPGEDMGPDRRLDYIFTSKNLAQRCRSARYIVDEVTGLLSDHYPMTAVFDVPVRPKNPGPDKP